ncbi:MAG: fumarylacetoacetate hydrolase family protein [Deferribacteraceae bacterium]|jgi:hypothetical protein|nr:fumarylacetoacetate hydrolase family protein [Deferribacteraceae bacterium]
MRFVRYTDKKSGNPVEMKGVLDNAAVYRLHGSFLNNYTVENRAFSTDEIVFLPPVLPAAIMCVNPSYAKSTASLAGNRSRVKIPAGLSYIYCLPRTAFVIKNLPNNSNGSAALFGVTLMLDFFTEAGNPAATASYDGYTVLGPSICTEVNGWIGFQINDKKLFNSAVPEDKYVKFLGEFFSVMTFRAGDILALTLTEDVYKCTRGDMLSLAYGEDLLEAYII